jgi:hypothetical protein
VAIACCQGRQAAGLPCGLNKLVVEEPTSEVNVVVTSRIIQNGRKLRLGRRLPQTRSGSKLGSQIARVATRAGHRWQRNHPSGYLCLAVSRQSPSTKMVAVNPEVNITRDRRCYTRTRLGQGLLTSKRTSSIPFSVTTTRYD